MLFKKYEKRDPEFADIYEHKYGTRSTGVRHPLFFEHIPEKVPELIVPDLTGFELKPYVSYQATLRTQVNLSSFYSSYQKKVAKMRGQSKKVHVRQYQRA